MKIVLTTCKKSSPHDIYYKHYLYFYMAAFACAYTFHKFASTWVALNQLAYTALRVTKALSKPNFLGL